MTNLLILLGIVLAAFIIIITLVVARRSDPKLTKCGYHKWTSVYLVNSIKDLPVEMRKNKSIKELREYLEHSRKRKSNVCLNCGMISGTDSFLSPTELANLQGQQRKIDSAVEAARVINDAKQAYIELYLKQHKLTRRDAEVLVKFVNSYDSFLSELSLESASLSGSELPDSGPDSSGI